MPLRRLGLPWPPANRHMTAAMRGPQTGNCLPVRVLQVKVVVETGMRAHTPHIVCFMSTNIALSNSTDKYVSPMHTNTLLEPNRYKFMISYFMSSQIMIKYNNRVVVVQC